MNIIQREKAPPALIGIIEDAYEGIPNIKSVVIGASMPWLVRGTNRALGGYDPQTGVIFIDMENCARCIEWMAKGCMYIPNVWINLMYTVHHELIHACQVLDDPELATIHPTPQEKEDEANEMALSAVWSWFERGGIIPPLEEMEYVGQYIAKVLNVAFSLDPDMVLQEIEAVKTGGVAKVESVLASHDHFNDNGSTVDLGGKTSIQILYENIDAGKIGTKSGQQRYLKASEFLALDDEGTFPK
jgi:hypothetical protein